MDILPLLDELRGIARNGLEFAGNDYDRQRYERLIELVSEYYGASVSVPSEGARERLCMELGVATPKVGADAAIFDQEGRILLMQRSDDEKWCLPCGWVELNESPAEAAVRETREETGLEVECVSLVDVFARFPSEENGPHSMISVVYYCRVTGGEMRLSNEGLDLRYWFYDKVENWHRNHRDLAKSAHEFWKARES